MSIFGKLIKTAFDTVELPIAIVKDVATLGGVIVDRDEPYTVSKVKNVAEDLGDVKDDLGDL